MTSPGPHPAQGLSDVVHQRTRLGILAVLSEGSKVQFGFLQQSLRLTDGNLSRHLKTLEDIGYVKIEKGYEGRRPKTWLRITRAGQRALRVEIDLLKQLVSLVEVGGQQTQDQPADPEPRTLPIIAEEPASAGEEG